MAGLYSGITFSKDPASSTAGPAAAASTSKSAAQAAAPTAEQNETERQRQAALADAEAYAAQQAELAAKEASENARKAALGFQPVVRKRPVPGKASRPAGAGAGAGTTGVVTANTGSASPAGTTSISAGATISAAPSLFLGASNPSDASRASASTVSAPPMDLKDFETSDSGRASTGATLTGRTLTAPPSMTLDDAGEDVNGFRATQAGKKAANKGKKKNKNKNKKEEDPALAWTAEYDPARPTDYAEYKAYSRMVRAERRAQIVREREREKRKRMAESYGESGSGSEYTESDEDDSDAERRKRIANANNRFFAPPTTYESSPAPPAASEDSDRMKANENKNHSRSPYDGAGIAAESSNAAGQEQADDPWASWAAVPKQVDDPFARRMALSQQTGSERPLSRHPPPSASYSQAPLSEQQVPAASPPVNSFNSMQPPPRFQQAHSLPVPPPSIGQSPGQSFPMPPSLFPPEGPPAPPHIGMQPDSQLEQAPAERAVPIAIAEAQARAKAIAARLASLGKPGLSGKSPLAADDPARPTSAQSPYANAMLPVPSADEPIPGLGMPAAPAAVTPQMASSTPGASQNQANARPEDFAKNLMAKYGWEKGQGLGATSQGIVNPLALANSQQGKGKNKQEQQQQQQHQPRGAPVGIATAKGRIVSDIKTEKEREERAKYGEPTRVVCLSNMVGRNEVDDELVSDVGESKTYSIL